jgi:dimeric dUTPase (all-alpha-NTP-PPase superfamily)
MKAEDKLPLATRLTCLKSSFKTRRIEKWTDKELLEGFDLLIKEAKDLHSQLKEEKEQLLTGFAEFISLDIFNEFSNKEKVKMYLDKTSNPK